MRRFRSINDASNARARMNENSARLASAEELALIESLLPARAEWRALLLASLTSARVFDDIWRHGQFHVHIDAPLIPTQPRYYTRRGVDRLGAPVALSLLVIRSTSFSLHCDRDDQKPFAGYPSIESLGELEIR